MEILTLSMNRETEAQQKGGVKLLLVLHSYGNALGESYGNALGESCVSSQDFRIVFPVVHWLKTSSESLSHKVSQTQAAAELVRAERFLVTLLLTGLPESSSYLMERGKDSPNSWHDTVYPEVTGGELMGLN